MDTPEIPGWEVYAQDAWGDASETPDFGLCPGLKRTLFPCKTRTFRPMGIDLDPKITLLTQGDSEVQARRASRACARVTSRPVGRGELCVRRTRAGSREARSEWAVASL
jgi:hypothetical protein